MHQSTQNERMMNNVPGTVLSFQLPVQRAASAPKDSTNQITTEAVDDCADDHIP
jgi:hypothetical protein